jgi:hypothetical protein
MTDDATFHNDTVQQADFRLIHSHCANCQIVTDCTTHNELAIHNEYIRHYSTLPENPDTPETTRIILKVTQTTKNRTAT